METILATYIIIAHCFLIYIVIDRKKNSFFNYFGHCLYIINNYINRKNNVQTPNKKDFNNNFYDPIINKSKDEKPNFTIKSFFSYFLLYFKFILFIWWAYLLYIIIANILLFLDETLGDR